MCRLFASISREGSRVDRSVLLGAFFEQSRLHPDGWGMARFTGSGPQVIKEPVEAGRSALLPEYMGWATEPLLMAHVRKGSVGGSTMENTHPFLGDGWVFEHNGTFDMMDRVLDELSLESKGKLRGATDSEAFFLLLLQNMRSGENPVTGITRTVRFLHGVRGPKTTALNFIMSDGQRLYVLNSAFIRPDYYNMYFLADQEGRGMIFSSKPLDGTEGWKRLEKHTLMVVDRKLHVQDHLIE